MFYFHKTSEEIQTLATYAGKVFSFALQKNLWPGALPLGPAGGKAPDPSIFLQFLLFPQTVSTAR